MHLPPSSVESKGENLGSPTSRADSNDQQLGDVARRGAMRQRGRQSQ